MTGLKSEICMSQNIKKERLKQEYPLIKTTKLHMLHHPYDKNLCRYSMVTIYIYIYIKVIIHENFHEKITIGHSVIKSKENHETRRRECESKASTGETKLGKK